MRRPARYLLLLICLAGTRALAAENKPYIGYLYPAGGQAGTTYEAQLGGENISNATAAVVSGKGVKVTIVNPGNPDQTKGENRKKKRKENQTVLDEIVKLTVTIAPDAEPGPREICVVTVSGVSNKRLLQVGQLMEVRKNELKDKDNKSDAFQLPALPLVINGQILPGLTDKFKFYARNGQHLVVEVSARALIPYIADAVPGWFQPIVSLHDAHGQEVAFSGEYRFSQDPVLFFDVPADGEYTLAIRDSIYRGRQDFVYRMRVGELPFITGIFPLGARQGDKPAAIKVFGKNLSSNSTLVPVNSAETGTEPLSVYKGGLLSNNVPLAIGNLPEVLQNENSVHGTQDVTPPVLINGCVGRAGEKNSYSFEGQRGQQVCIDVLARRLASPLDSYLTLLNSRGEIVTENDDMPEKGEGLLTHMADSQILCKLPDDGRYTIKLYDTEGKGGADYSYRLRIGPPVPDFALRMTPAALAVPLEGSTALTVHALRHEGFSGEIQLFLGGSTTGLSIEGGTIPENADSVKITLSASAKAVSGTTTLTLLGRASSGGKTLLHPAVPAELQMQAFLYRHLVPFNEETLLVTKAAPFGVTAKPEGGCVTLQIGKEQFIPVHVMRTHGFDGPIRVQLVDPPKGIVLQKVFIPADKDAAFISIRADSSVDAKLKGNLILTATMALAKPQPETTPPPAANPPAAASKSSPDTKTDGKTDTKATATTTPAKNGNTPAVERVTVTSPAISFKIAENPERKNSHAETAAAGRNNHP